ncbi:hypothetical protein D9756_010067 [Leucocoprinus leucothites]|uniref:Uncharacterized protein n=1 Tax=Leucocoprinus leucothites TaxID=201217 RepID=A0A8H5FRX2_9AGAR|nr:hypothetical protein D9756_010067 [Leucoagaricus leucothites]
MTSPHVESVGQDSQQPVTSDAIAKSPDLLPRGYTFEKPPAYTARPSSEGIPEINSLVYTRADNGRFLDKLSFFALDCLTIILLLFSNLVLLGNAAEVENLLAPNFDKLPICGAVRDMLIDIKAQFESANGPGATFDITQLTALDLDNFCPIWLKDSKTSDYYVARKAYERAREAFFNFGIIVMCLLFAICFTITRPVSPDRDFRLPHQ